MEMAGVCKKRLFSGKWRGWYMRTKNGKRKPKFFTGTRSWRVTKAMAEKLEDDHRQIELGYRSPPKTADKMRTREFWEVASEYLAWGRLHGGKHGLPWADDHADKVESDLVRWRDSLNIRVFRRICG